MKKYLKICNIGLSFSCCFIFGHAIGKSGGILKPCQDTLFSSSIDPSYFQAKAEIYGMLGLTENREFTGKGIRIGIIDAPATMTSAHVLHSDQIDTYYNGALDHKNHGRLVFNVLSFIAPDAEYYSTFTLKNGPDYRDFTTCVEELSRDYQVDLINHSQGDGSNQGTYLARGCAEVDRISKTDGVLVFNATGNKDKAILTSSSATGLNSIGVTTEKSGPGVTGLNPEYQGIIPEFSFSAPGSYLYGIPGALASYSQPSVSGYVNSDPSEYSPYAGTSFATPLATGIAALILEEFPNLKNQPNALKNILLCSVQDGFVNYQNARLAAQNYMSFTIGESCSKGDTIFSINAKVPKGYVLKASATVQYDANKIEKTADSNLTVPASKIDYSKIGLSIVDKGGYGGLLAQSKAKENTTSLSFRNASPDDVTFQINVEVEAPKKEKRIENATLCFYVAPEPSTSIQITSEIALDIPPTFSYKTPAINDYVNIVFSDYLCNEVLRYNHILSNWSLSLTKEDWNKLINLPNVTFYVWFEYMSENSEMRTKTFKFREPSNFANSLQICPEDFGFSQSYVSMPTTEEHNFDGFSIKSERLRCGYIKKMYNNLSPRKKGAGKAYLELTFERPVFAVSFGITAWKNSEILSFREGDSLTLDIKKGGKWEIGAIDILKDHPELNLYERNQIIRYKIDGEIEGIRFCSTSEPVGSANDCRTCIDDIVLSLTEEAANYELANYEPVVVQKDFSDGVPR